jgi:hypothetical protein
MAAMRRPSLRLRLAAALIAAGLLVSAPQAAQPARLRQLGGVDEMKAWFNANTAHPRVIFLLSPT